MTDRLYYDDSYLTSFDAVVNVCVEKDGAYHVRLDCSAFYPTSGGQPFDTGTINGIAVTDVYVGEDHDVWHVLEAPVAAGTPAHGEINWPRRFDHMQQHAGDHMIASALWRLLGGVTIGLHISHDVSTIDVAMPEGVTRISREDIARVEQDVNERIQRDVPVKCWFPNADELKSLPLRKPPTVNEHVRIVAIGTDEMVACGGTYPSTAGQLGMVKILSVAPARGKMRVTFVAGMRAFRDYQMKNDCAAETSNLLSTSVDKMAVSVAAMQEALNLAKAELNRLRRERMLMELEGRMKTAPRLPDGTVILAQQIDGDINLLKDVVSHLIRTPKVVALMGVKNEANGAMFAFARSGDVDIHMGQLLGKASKVYGGKGGGRPDFAQGGGDPRIIDEALQILKEGKQD